MDLRDRLREVIEEYVDDGMIDECTDRVLAIPEIQDALSLKAIRDSKVGYERQG